MKFKVTGVEAAWSNSDQLCTEINVTCIGDFYTKMVLRLPASLKPKLGQYVDVMFSPEVTDLDWHLEPDEVEP